MWLAMIAPPRRDGHQIAVVHARAPDDPWGLIGQTPHHERMFRGRLDDGRVKLADGDAGAAGRGQIACAARDQHGIIGQDADAARFALTRLKPDAQPVTGKDRDAGIVCRKDAFQPHPEGLREKRNVGGQRARRQMNLGPDVLHVFPQPGHAAQRRCAKAILSFTAPV